MLVITLLFFALSTFAQNDYQVKGSIGKIGGKAFASVEDEFQTITINEWVGNRILFLQQQKSLQSFGYLSFKGGKGDLRQPTYDECVGRVGIIEKVECRDIACNATIRMEDNGQKYDGEVLLNTLRNVAFVRDIDSARAKWLGDTIWYNRSELLTYDEATDDTKAEKIPKYSKVVVSQIVASWHEFIPVRFIIRTMDGKEGFVDIAVSGTNQSTISTIKLKFSSFFQTVDPRSLNTWSESVWSAIEREEVFIGMTSDQASMSWGKPLEVKQTLTANGGTEQWVYRDGNYLYVENGVVTAIQN